MKFCYNLLFLVFFIVSAPYYFFRLWKRGNWKQNFLQRFGVYSQNLHPEENDRIVWFHAVSVGEINLCVHLIKEFKKYCPQFKILASTTTTTGMEELKRKLSSADIIKIYYPVDYKNIVQKAYNFFSPKAIILIEAEIWPNFLWEAKKRKIPTFLLNARLSDRSFSRYMKAGFIFKDIFSSFNAVGVQDENDKKNIISLGVLPQNVTIAGNLKFDGTSTTLDKKLDVPSLLKKLHITPDSQILVAGSTHSGEEILLAKMALRLKKRFPHFFLIIVPRHFERCKSVLAELKSTGIRAILRTDLDSSIQTFNETPDCLLVNTTGELRYFYGVATLTFIGKSLTANGGQNPIEPAALGKPVLFGPNMQNFRSIVRSFLSNDAAIQIQNAEELEQQIIFLLSNPDHCQALGRNAYNVVLKNQGGIKKSVEILSSVLKNK